MQEMGVVSYNDPFDHTMVEALDRESKCLDLNVSSATAFLYDVGQVT